MQENFVLVQKGFRILVGTLSGFIGREMSRQYGKEWWGAVLSTLNDPYGDLPAGGDYGKLVDSLDIANCLHLIDRQWNDVFRRVMDRNCRTWSKELIDVRNIISHLGARDLDQPDAERALNTMVLLCSQLDEDSAAELEEIYKEVRARADDMVAASAPIVYTGIAQPESASEAGAMQSGNLLELVAQGIITKTEETRNITFNGKTTVYPVYAIPLEYLYYNDQNDRIATWISRYRADHGEDSLERLSREDYNNIIENFIYESNPDALQKTQNNIKAIGQQQSGVTLADGRIVDGNRRFTCQRRLQRSTNKPCYFKTAIMEADAQTDRKQIKLLELSIQHGEEKKVDYDQIDFAIGTYHDVVQTKLLTIEEYAESSNSSVADVKKRLEIAGTVNEFLEHIRLPEQYHVAREYQVYSLFQEMLSPLHQLDDNGKHQLKSIAFNNAMMKAIPDQRKFIRDIKSLVKNGTYPLYFDEQKKINDSIQQAYACADIHKKADVDKFAEEHAELKEKLSASMEHALLRSRSQQIKTKPAENVSKCINLLLDIDPRLFDKLGPDERRVFQSSMDELVGIVDSFRSAL